MKYLKLFEEYLKDIKMHDVDVNLILNGYIEASIWTEEERLNDEYSSKFNTLMTPDTDLEDSDEELVKQHYKTNPLENFTKDDIEPNSLIKAYNDIKEFIKICGDAATTAIEENGFSQFGHDFWLTRNHNGSGFFDRGYDDDVEKILMDNAHKMGEIDLYINDDMKLSFSNENQ